ncbi:MAG: methyltransferase domain-containing protein [Endomicrobiales bacterium]|nr:methyltransferase domain-containing protein [Endomicrobiales bacterium]
MKRRFLEYVVCPECGSEFSLKVFLTDDASSGDSGDVAEGVLECAKCGSAYPIIESVPRILRKEIIGELVRGYDGFVSKYGLNIEHRGVPDVKKDRSLRSKEVAKGYEYGWSIYSSMLAEYESEFRHVLGEHLSPADFKDKVVLDAGCGMGRFAYFAKKYGAKTLIAFDMSEAVLVAQNTIFKNSENAYFFQGDIYYLPLKKIFDIIYCIGVIHHLPSPNEGVQHLACFLKPGAALFLWVYGHSGIKYPLKAIRVVTRRIPFGWSRGLSYLFGTALYLFNVLYRALRKLPGFSKAAECVPFNQYADRSWAGVCWICQDHITVPIINFFKKGDVESFAKETSLKQIDITCRYPGRMGRSWRFFARNA